MLSQVSFSSSQNFHDFKQILGIFPCIYDCTIVHNYSKKSRRLVAGLEIIDTGNPKCILYYWLKEKEKTS